MVLEKYPEIGYKVWCATREEWIPQTESFNYDDTSPYTPTEKWSEITNCAVPYEAADSDLSSIADSAYQDASGRYNAVSTRLASLLYPDSLQDVANTVDRIVQFKTSFDEFIDDQESSSFQKIAELFKDGRWFSTTMWPSWPSGTRAR